MLKQSDSQGASPSLTEETPARKRPYSAPAIVEDVPLESQSLACAGGKDSPELECGSPFTS